MINAVINRNTGKVVARYRVQSSSYPICDEDQQMFSIVNRNYEMKALQERLDAIKNKRRKGGFIVQIMSKLRRTLRRRRNLRLQKKSASR
jgi:hypothetical protein